MFELKTWMKELELSAKEMSQLLEVPLSTVEGWVYKGAVPKPENVDT